MQTIEIAIIENSLGYTFISKELLINALVHRSYLNEKNKRPEIKANNERLEFLGDAVLELVVTEYLFGQYSDQEGFLTAVRAALVNYRNLSMVAKQLNLENHVLISRGEQLGSDEEARLSILADCLEAIIGAIYLDGGYDKAKDFIQTCIISQTDEIISKELYKDPKTKFQEFIQKKYKITPRYKVIESKGKDHEKIFVSAVFVQDKLLSKGVGRSKQESEVEAAKLALVAIENEKVK